MKKNKVAIIILCLVMLAGIGVLAWYYKTTHEDKKSSLPVIGAEDDHKVAPFSFVNQDGKTITNEDVKGKIYVVEYFFTTCKSICPRMNEHMERVYKAYRGNNDVLILSHTVDPQDDTVGAMKAYSLKYDADASQWMFLTGDKKQLYDMARYSYLINAKEDTAGVSIQDDFIHDNHYTLVDDQGRVRGFYDGLSDGDVGRLIGDIKILLQEKNQ